MCSWKPADSAGNIIYNILEKPFYLVGKKQGISWDITGIWPYSFWHILAIIELITKIHTWINY